MFRNHLLPSANIIHQVDRVVAPGEVVQVSNTRCLNLIPAALVHDKEAAPKFKPIELFSPGEGDPMGKQVIAEVRADDRVHMLR